MSLDLSIFLYIYIGFLFVWAIFSVVAVFHMFKFGFKNFITYAAIVSYLAISFLIIGISLFYILQTDWSRPLIDLNKPTTNQQLW